MKWLILHSLILSTLFVASCGTGVPPGSVMYPTVEEMARKDAEWGLPPRQVKPKVRPMGTSDWTTPAPAAAPAAPVQAPAMLAPAPEALTQPAPQEVPPALR